jgi:hypothetical protein
MLCPPKPTKEVKEGNSETQIQVTRRHTEDAQRFTENKKIENVKK